MPKRPVRPPGRPTRPGDAESQIAGFGFSGRKNELLDYRGGPNVPEFSNIHFFVFKKDIWAFMGRVSIEVELTPRVDTANMG
jgi:hypothetical protein